MRIKSNAVRAKFTESLFNMNKSFYNYTNKKCFNFELEDTIINRFIKITNSKPCYLSVQIDGWLSVTPKNKVATVLSFNSYSFEKRSIVLNFIPADDKTAIGSRTYFG